jgi:hypothetical protein
VKNRKKLKPKKRALWDGDVGTNAKRKLAVHPLSISLF